MGRDRLLGWAHSGSCATTAQQRRYDKRACMCAEDDQGQLLEWAHGGCSCVLVQARERAGAMHAESETCRCLRKLTLGANWNGPSMRAAVLHAGPRCGQGPPPPHSQTSVAKAARGGIADLDVRSEHGAATGTLKKAADGILRAARQALHARSAATAPLPFEPQQPAR